MPLRRARLFPISMLALLCFCAISSPALEWVQTNGYRFAPLTVPTNGKVGFSEMVPVSAGIRFTNLLNEERSLTNQIYLNGSGVAAGDVDGDGLCDLYFCGLDSPNALYRNLGNWRFADITAEAGVACANQASTGAALADVDNDGDLDLLVNGIREGTRLFLNDGKAKFHEATDEAGLRNHRGSTSFALADIDGDGLLDLYVVNYRSDTMGDLGDVRFKVGVTNGVYQVLSVNGVAPTTPDLMGRYSIENNSSVLENGEPDVMFRNLGNGKFSAVSWTNGTFLDEQGVPMATPYDWGLSASFHDLNGDGAPDLYVCNDFQSPDRIWINDQHGHFRALPADAVRHTSLFSMGVDFADIDRDGYDDIFVADMLAREHVRRQIQVMNETAFTQARQASRDRPQLSRNTLFHNRGNGTYAEIGQLAGLDASDWSWAPAFIDVDLDGYEDLLITTGHLRDLQNIDVAQAIETEKKNRPMSWLEKMRLRGRFPKLDTPNAAFRNRGDLTFEDVTATWHFDSRAICHGMALADLDNDGDLDVIINCLGAAPLLYRNNSSAPRLAVKLHGKQSNSYGVGARITITTAGLPQQTTELKCGGRYLSSDDFRRTFAAGNKTNHLKVEVRWPGGARSIVDGVAANSFIEVDETQASPVGEQTTPKPKPFFEDISQVLNHRHIDEPFDDFARQPLLPHQLSTLGPGVAWFDFNADGWDDLLISAGRGGRVAAFRNDGKGSFVPQRSKLLEARVTRDVTTFLGWRPNSTNIILLAGLSSYEETTTNSLLLRETSIVTGQDSLQVFPKPGSIGPMSLADFDGDGDLDLFIGGRVIPGRYPEPASSIILKNNKGSLEYNAQLSEPFSCIGLVSSATAVDLNVDGWPDLVLACEWGPIRVFRNESGHFVSWDLPVSGYGPTSAAVSLSKITGWWNSVATGDFDGDGRLDLVAGNWGRNTARQRFKPLQLYFANSESSQTLSLLEAHYDPGLRSEVPAHHWGALNGIFPSLRQRFTNYTSFSSASISDILPVLSPVQQVNAATLDTVLLLNRGDHFQLQALPIEAQFSAVFGIGIGDFDGDGNEDLFFAQNSFDVPEGRLDAGCGLWLRGNGDGTFRAIGPAESGIIMSGEGRGVAVCDFNHDGRLDLVAGQNNGPTKLFRNQTAKPGLTVHLRGPDENLQAIGATVRLIYKSGKAGPVHALQMGSGYWSQDSTDVILGIKEEPAAVEIRWPNGKIERVSVTPDTRRISRGFAKN